MIAVMREKKTSSKKFNGQWGLGAVGPWQFRLQFNFFASRRSVIGVMGFDDVWWI